MYRVYRRIGAAHLHTLTQGWNSPCSFSCQIEYPVRQGVNDEVTYDTSTEMIASAFVIVPGHAPGELLLTVGCFLLSSGEILKTSDRPVVQCC